MAGASDDAELLLQSEAEVAQDELDAESLSDFTGAFTCFLSYCDADSAWAQELISKLESPERGFRVCHHERDFLPGKPIIDNMGDAIQRSQKILLVMSADYLSSRWCTWERHMSILENTRNGKAIVPILVGQVYLPFQLKHLTCLDSADPNFFIRLETVLRTPNSLMELSATLPSPSRTMHNGMLLEVINPRERNLQPWEVGTFNEYLIPPILMLLIHLQDFMKAMSIINKPPAVHFFKKEQRRKNCKQMMVLLILGVIATFVHVYLLILRGTKNLTITVLCAIGAVAAVALLLGALWYVHTWPRHEYRRQQTQLHRRIGDANHVFLTRSLLAGCGPRGELQFIYASVEQCRALVVELIGASRPAATPFEADEAFAKAVRLFSCAYVAAAVRKEFGRRSEMALGASHAAEGMCFCEYAQHAARTRHAMSLADFLARKNKLLVSDYKLNDIHVESNASRRVLTLRF